MALPQWGLATSLTVLCVPAAYGSLLLACIRRMRWCHGKVAELELRREQMKVVRIYTGADNQTHFEELPLETFAASPGDVCDLIGADRYRSGPLESGPGQVGDGFSQRPAPSVCGDDGWAVGN